jgi:acyl-CoA reductase-like NAD-dependent aldehyde dehydrogenase
MDPYKIYIGGEFITTGTELKVHNPYNGKLIGFTFLAQKKELNAAILKAEKVLEEMKELPSYKRYEILIKIADFISSDKERLAIILSKESAKPLKLARIEIERGVQTFIAAAEESKRLPKEYISIDWTKPGENREGLVKYFPVGIIAGIAPFNFPLNLAVHKIAPAIASGNCIILKPARTTPLSVLELAKIIDKTDLPKGAVSILPMDRETGNLLVTDERIKMLTFTGSSEVGWKMKNDCGKKKITLELGGNAGVIVTESADINLAISKCLSGSFSYSGQVCIHTQRIYVHNSVFDIFTEQLAERTLKLKAGEPSSDETDISSLIDEENAVRVEKWVNEAAAAGAKILCGGKRKGNFYEPTIISNTNLSMKVCNCEIFGPVVIVEKYNDFRGAVEQLNDTEYGLQAGVFTNNIREMNFAFNNIEAGGIMINDVPTYRVDHMPYGGIKNSGFGREGVKYAIFEMLEPKLLVKDIL